jgi:hypothetical protein
MKTILLSWLLCVSTELGLAACPGTIADHVVFRGIEPTQNVAQEIGYPKEWTYLQLGGGEVIPGKGPLRGATAHTYLATRPDGSRVVLKSYRKQSSLRRDQKATTFLRRKFDELGIEIAVARYKVSKISPSVLETEYLEGQDLKSFLRSNRQNKGLVREMTRFYNEQVLKFRAHVEEKPDLLQSVPDEAPVLYHMPRDRVGGDLFVLLKPENLIVTGDPDRPGSLRLVLIDPE